jgi:hypothetical protein
MSRSHWCVRKKLGVTGTAYTAFPWPIHLRSGRMPPRRIALARVSGGMWMNIAIGQLLRLRRAGR